MAEDPEILKKEDLEEAEVTNYNFGHGISFSYGMVFLLLIVRDLYN